MKSSFASISGDENIADGDPDVAYYNEDVSKREDRLNLLWYRNNRHTLQRNMWYVISECKVILGPVHFEKDLYQAVDALDKDYLVVHAGPEDPNDINATFSRCVGKMLQLLNAGQHCKLRALETRMDVMNDRMVPNSYHSDGKQKDRP